MRATTILTPLADRLTVLRNRDVRRLELALLFGDERSGICDGAARLRIRARACERGRSRRARVLAADGAGGTAGRFARRPLPPATRDGGKCTRSDGRIGRDRDRDRPGCVARCVGAARRARVGADARFSPRADGAAPFTRSLRTGVDRGERDRRRDRERRQRRRARARRCAPARWRSQRGDSALCPRGSREWGRREHDPGSPAARARRQSVQIRASRRRP